MPEWKSGDTYPRPSGSVWFKTTLPNGGAKLIVKLWNSATLLWDEVATPFYDNNASAIYWLDSTGGGANLAIGDLYAKTNVANDTQPMANFTIFRRQASGATKITSAAITSSAPSRYIYIYYASN